MADGQDHSIHHGTAQGWPSGPGVWYGLMMSKQDHRLQGRRVLITGASGGIGAALAREFAQRGARLLLCARREGELLKRQSELRSAGTACHVVPLDITQPESRAQLVDWITAEWQALDILVNNAGIGAIGSFEDAAPARLQSVMQVNFAAPVELIRCMLPWLRRGQDPMIVNMGSVLGHCAVPEKSEYCASKFALRGFSDSLRMELRRVGIHVLLVSPSTTSTDFFDNVIEGRGQHRKRWLEMTPEYVARRTVRAVSRRQRELFLPSAAGWMLWLAELFPGLFDAVLSHRGKV